MEEEVEVLSQTQVPEAKENNKQDMKYFPLVLNLGVFFSSKASPFKNSLSLNVSRDYIIFKFSGVNPDTNEKTEINRRLNRDQAWLFYYMLEAVLAKRLEIAKASFEVNKEFKPVYFQIPELDFEVNSVYYSKENNGFDKSGKIGVTTYEVDGIQRVCLTGYDENGKSIPVVLYNDESQALTKVSEKTIADPGDLGFYRFCFELKGALTKTLEYAGFDKLYQMLNRIMGKMFGNGASASIGGGSFRPMYGGNLSRFPNRPVQRKEVVNNEADADLYSENEEVTF